MKIFSSRSRLQAGKGEIFTKHCIFNPDVPIYLNTESLGRAGWGDEKRRDYVCGLSVGKFMLVLRRSQQGHQSWCIHGSLLINILRSPQIDTAFLCFTNRMTMTEIHTPKCAFQNLNMLVGSRFWSPARPALWLSLVLAVIRRSCWKSLENGWQCLFFFPPAQKEQIPDSSCFDLGASSIGDAFTLHYSYSVFPCFCTELVWI